MAISWVSRVKVELELSMNKVPGEQSHTLCGPEPPYILRIMKVTGTFSI